MLILFFEAKYSEACGSVKNTIVLELNIFELSFIFFMIAWWPKCNPSKFPIVPESFTSLNLNLNKSHSSILFDDKTPSGEKIKIKSKDKCYVIFSAPQNNMIVSEQNPSSDLIVFVKRAKIENDKELSIIPDPVFEPHYEKNISYMTK